MIKKGDPVAFGRDTGMADPANGLVKYLPDWEFQTIAPARVAYHGKTLTIWAPVRPLHVVKNLTGDTTRQRHAGQRATVYPGPDLAAPEQDGHLSGGRDRQDVSPSEAKRT